MNSAGSTAVAPRVRLYVVDPRKFRKPGTESTVISTVDTPRFLLPKATAPPSVTRSVNPTSTTANIPMTMTMTTSAATSVINSHGPPVPPTENLKTNTKKKKPRKRKADRSNANSETEDDKKLKAFLSTESTTRVGRVSKNPPRLSQNETTNSGHTAPPPPKIKIREPPEVFRCQVCQKVYLGHTKLRLHYKTFPDHQIKSAAAPPPAPIPPIPQRSQFFPPTHSFPPSFLSPSPPPTSRASISVGVQVAFSPESFFAQTQSQRNLFPIPMTPPRSLSRNSASEASGYNCNSGLEPITVPDLCLPTSMSPSPNQSPSPKENGTNSNHGFCESAFSSIRRISSQNPDLHSHASHSHSPTIFHRHHNMYQFNPALTPPGDNCHNSNEKNHPPPATTPVLKAIWEFVEERMIQQGINQILAEISEVADRLSKLARDKFIPIREEEERLYCSSPIIQVDNPFLSNLLDLPFGTYVFREDAGVRIRPPPPPSAAELSLTGEVDVDKFLSPDILSLPHLTNIDFAAIL